MSIGYGSLKAYYSKMNNKIREDSDREAKSLTKANNAAIEDSRTDINNKYANAVESAYRQRLQAEQGIASEGDLNESTKLQLGATAGNNEYLLNRQKTSDNAAFDNAILKNDALLKRVNVDTKVALDPSADMLDLNLQERAQAEEIKDSYDPSKFQKDYQAEIDRLKALGVGDGDYRIQALQKEREEKLHKQEVMQDLIAVSKEAGYDYDFDADIFELKQQGYTNSDWEIQYLQEAKRLQTRNKPKKTKSSGKSDSDSDDDLSGIVGKGNGVASTASTGQLHDYQGNILSRAVTPNIGNADNWAQTQSKAQLIAQQMQKGLLPQNTGEALLKKLGINLGM